jgi:uncharacterized protein YdaU (DUF1376 family)
MDTRVNNLKAAILVGPFGAIEPASSPARGTNFYKLFQTSANSSPLHILALLKEPMPKADIWMPFFIGDYMADTMHLSTVQHGAYCLLIFAYWKNQGPLPDDDNQFAAIVKLPIKQWLVNRGVIAKFFKIVEGFWIQKRIDVEIKKASVRKEIAGENGRHGGRPKKPSGLFDQNPAGNPAGYPEHNLNHNPEKSSSPSPSSSPLEHIHKDPFENQKKLFDEARKFYPGNKNGLDTEWKNFKRNNPNLSEVIPLLFPAIMVEKEYKKNLLAIPGAFVPQWANFSTWINQKRWNQEFGEINATNRKNNPVYESTQQRKDRRLKEVVARFGNQASGNPTGDSETLSIGSEGNS